MVCISSFISAFPLVGFSGSRFSSSAAALSCQSFLPLLSSFTGSVAVGCASGVDLCIRSAFASASVFRVSSYLVGGRVVRSSFALRSSALVHHIASSSGLLIAFPSGAAPSQLVVSSSFGGFGSGTWGSIALALGLSVPVLVVLPSSLVSFPAPSSVAIYFTCIGSAPCGGLVWLASH